MTKYSFILLSGMKDEFLETLRGLGLMDICRSVRPVDDTSRGMMERIEALRLEIRDLQAGKDAALSSLESELKDLQTEKKAAEVWGDFSREEIDSLASQGVALHFYSTVKSAFDASWSETYALEVISSDDKTYFVIAGDNEGFPLKEMPVPEKSISQIEALIADKKGQIKDRLAEIEVLKKEIPAKQAEMEKMNSDLSLYLASLQGESAAEDSLVVFEAFAPTENDAALKEKFDSMSIYWCSEKACAEDNPPIKLKNNKFFSLFEVLTKMYGMPVYNEFDPTPVVGFFFMLFFAFCIADAAYGIILILFGIGVNKKWIKIDMFKSIGSLITVLGVASFIIGTLFGGVFGVSLSEAQWVPESIRSLFIAGKVTIAGASYDKLMILAVLIGIFHLCLAMIIKTVCFIRRFGVKKNIATIGWTLFIVGSVILISITVAGLLGPDALKWAIIIIGAISALAIYIFNTPGRNPLVNFGAGLWNTYEVATGLLGDVLSYIRLYALGLAGGMLGGAFNDLAMMVAGPGATWQWVFAALILVAGHILNLLMACLGAFVHPLRLTFVEYFKNSGYSGRGRAYNPLTK